MFSGGTSDTARGENRERGKCLCQGSAFLTLHAKAQLRGKLEPPGAGYGPSLPPTHAYFHGCYLHRGQKPR